jgi:hypothetical protein
VGAGAGAADAGAKGEFCAALHLCCMAALRHTLQVCMMRVSVSLIFDHPVFLWCTNRSRAAAWRPAAQGVCVEWS